MRPGCESCNLAVLNYISSGMLWHCLLSCNNSCISALGERGACGEPERRRVLLIRATSQHSGTQRSCYSNLSQGIITRQFHLKQFLFHFVLKSLSTFSTLQTAYCGALTDWSCDMHVIFNISNNRFDKNKIWNLSIWTYTNIILLLAEKTIRT